MSDNYNYPMGADNSFAPWNATSEKETEYEVSVSQTLIKSDTVIIGGEYVTDKWIDEDGHVVTEIDEGEIDWTEEYMAQAITIPELLKKLEEYVIGDLKCESNNKQYNRYLNRILAACRGWELEETNVEKE